MAKRASSKATEDQPDLLGNTAPKADTKAKAATATKTKAKTETKAEPIAGPAVNKGSLTLVKSDPTSTISMLLQVMKDPKVPKESLRMAFDMHKEMIAEQARLDFIEAKRQMKRILPVINKDGKIEYRDKGDGKGKPKPLAFATYENLHDSCAEPLFEYGFDLTHVAEPGVPGMINVVTTLEHTNGHSVKSVLPMPHDASGGKSGAQGWASAFSFGKRINTIGLLDIVTRAPSDRDVDGAKVKRTKGGDPRTIDGGIVVENGDGQVGVATIEVCSEDQIIKVREAIEACGVSDKTFCKHFQIDKVSQLPADRYADALAACRSYAADKAEKGK